jgi:hypothetical protein
LRTGRGATTAFVGKTTDASNGSACATTGVCAIGDIVDWTTFANRWRSFGPNGSAFPAADHRGRCTSGSCAVWDWRLSASDAALRNLSGDGATANEPFIPGAPCPSAVHGDRALTDRAVTAEIAGDGVGDDDHWCREGERCGLPNTFLINALEIFFDEAGDDDGLCESDEACVFSPNFGAYQGEGDLDNRTCQFTDGVVHGVVMHGYPQNGG